MSILALCALIVSCTRTGSAVALISWSRPLPLGYWMTETLVIFLFCTVNCTWTGPQRVSATATVLLALEGAVAERALEGLELLEPADVVGAAVAEADVEPVVVEPTVP